jgi:hypothetical protein
MLFAQFLHYFQNSQQSEIGGTHLFRYVLVSAPSGLCVGEFTYMPR